MNFISFAFLILFAPVFLARLTIGRNGTEPLYRALILLASTIFVMWHIPAYILIMLVSIGSDFVAAKWLVAEPEGSPRRKLILFASLGVNLALLAVFKYTGFALDLAQSVTDALGCHYYLPHPEILLPMGISFYTFGSMSYTIDVFRRHMPPVRRFRDFYFFVTFFPHMVAGPIIRADNFFLQFFRRRRVHWKAINEGGWLIIYGAFLKMVCADNLAYFVNQHWANPEHSHSATVRIGLAFLFAMQIYCDFEGYSSIARGLAYWLGFRFPVNFNNPYLATSFRNFWERWHITLSTWLRDYLYVPLGGNRHSKLRTYVNLLTVMLLGGLWHGASLTFVAWGALHGGALAMERMLGMHSAAKKPLMLRVAWYFVVQAVVLVTWVFFRSQGLNEAIDFCRTMVWGQVTAPPLWLAFACLLTAPAIAFHFIGFLQEKRYLPLEAPFIKAIAAGAMLYAVVTCYGNSGDFIYFQF
ncbi:MAG: MBOAT family O-acyltransferase [Planctomycetaceae bacterium]